MAILSTDKNYIASGETFRITITDLDGLAGDSYNYSITGEGVTETHFEDPNDISGTIVLDENGVGYQDIETHPSMPTGENFVIINVSVNGLNDLIIYVYAGHHYIMTGAKVDLGDTFDIWRRKTNGLIGRLETLYASTHAAKTQTIIADGTSSTYPLTFKASNEDTVWYTVTIDGIFQNTDSAFSIDLENNQIIFGSVPPIDSEIHIIHKIDLGEVGNVGDVSPFTQITDGITSDVDVGGINTLDIIPAGTTLQEFAESLLLKTYYPTFTSPSNDITSTLAVEAGTTNYTLTYDYDPGSINGDLNGGIWDPQLKQNDFTGSVIEYAIIWTNTGAEIIPAVSATSGSFDFGAVPIEEGNNTYMISTSYAQGPQPLDSKGNPYNAPAPAGYAANNVNVQGFRKLFYGTDLSIVDSTNIRNLSNDLLNPFENTSFTINIPAGATNVAFAYPETLRDVDSVIYVEGLNAEVKTAFTQTIVTVLGANGYAGVNYKVYTFTPVNPFAEDATYIVTI